MSCRRYREELSRCLDGRLQSHARARVMHHIAGCDGCARFWEELKAAQELVLGLPQARVGSRFRDDVWQRIQAGEGAPDTIVREPVPMVTKARYGLLGAAAAALFILALHYGTSRSAVTDERPSEADRIAAKTPTATPLPFARPTVTELTPADVAAQTAERVSLAARSLRNRCKNLTNPSDFRPDVIKEVRREIETVQHGLVMLKLLRKEFGIEFRDSEARDCETRVLTTLEINSKLEQPEQVMRTLSALTLCSLDQLREKLLFSWESNIWNERFLREHQLQIRRVLPIVPVPLGPPGETLWGPPGEMRLRFWRIPDVPPPAGTPEQTEQPEKTEPPKLRERTRR